MIGSDLYAESPGGLLQEGLEAAESPLWVVNPTRRAMTELIAACQESAPAPPVRLFAARSSLKSLADDFPHASRAADLVDDDRLDVRTLPSVPRHSLLVTERSLVALVEREDGVAGLTTTRDGVVESTRETYDSRWERAEEFSLGTPPLSELRTTLESALGPAVREAFDRALSAVERDRDTGRVDAESDPLDEVSLALLVAASNRELLYDISRWGESVALASKATFSRTKNHLEEAGIVDTEKVPIDVGRPRLRLVVADDDLAGREIEQFVREARARLP